MASRLQTKPEISPKIGAKSKASTIRSQPYITLPYLSKKIGTSVDVKVDVKNMTEGRGTEGRGTEGRGTEGRGTEGRGTEGRGTEGRGTEGTRLGFLLGLGSRRYIAVCRGPHTF